MERNSDGTSIVKSISKFNLVTFGDVVRSVSNVSNSDLSSENALSILGSVGIGYIRFDTSSILDIFEGVGRKTSFASVVVEITSTVNKLLLREGNVLSLAEDVPVGLE